MSIQNQYLPLIFLSVSSLTLSSSRRLSVSSCCINRLAFLDFVPPSESIERLDRLSRIRKVFFMMTMYLQIYTRQEIKKIS